VLNSVAENAARICEANDALIYRFDGHRLVGVAEYGPLPGQLGKGPHVIDRRSIPGRAIIDRGTVHVHDLAVVPLHETRARHSNGSGDPIAARRGSHRRDHDSPNGSATIF
jgi:hypothetical protein